MEHQPAHGDNVMLLRWSADNITLFHWNGSELPARQLEGHWPILYVVVDSPTDQSFLHRMLGRYGYVSTRLAVDESELWRFHHPDGPKPL